MTTAPFTREELIQRARLVPRTWTGTAMIAGYLLLVVGIACLIGRGAEFASGRPPLLDLRIAAAVLVAGVVLSWWAGVRDQEQFVSDASASGLGLTDVRAIQDEAERLNDEEERGGA